MYYTCRLALSIVKKPLIDNGVYPVEELGSIGAALFYGYAFGKFFNGFLADHIPPKIFFALGLALSATMNLFMRPTGTVFFAVKFWAMNGWFQGFGAPSSVVSLSNWIAGHERGAITAFGVVVTSLVRVSRSISLPLWLQSMGGNMAFGCQPRCVLSLH